jgi:hypothetical protein
MLTLTEGAGSQIRTVPVTYSSNERGGQPRRRYTFALTTVSPQWSHRYTVSAGRSPIFGSVV